MAAPHFSRHARWLWRLAGWLLVAIVVWLSLTPEPISLPVTAADKLEHAVAYAVLMAWFSNLHETAARRAGLAAALIALGVALEFAQRWTGYRTFEVTDMLAGAAGVITGWLLAPPRTPNALRWLERRGGA